MTACEHCGQDPELLKRINAFGWEEVSLERCKLEIKETIASVHKLRYTELFVDGEVIGNFCKEGFSVREEFEKTHLVIWQNERGWKSDFYFKVYKIKESA